MPDKFKVVRKTYKSVCEINVSGNIIATYNSIKEAEATTGLKNIGAVCRGVRKHTQGRWFIYDK